jgi:hypothetical protein
MNSEDSLPCSKNPIERIMSYLSSTHTFKLYVAKICFNIILHSTPSYSDWSLPFRFPNPNFMNIFPFVLHEHIFFI